MNGNSLKIVIMNGLSTALRAPPHCYAPGHAERLTRPMRSSSIAWPNVNIRQEACTDNLKFYLKPWRSTPQFSLLRTAHCAATDPGAAAPATSFSVYRVTGDGRCMFRALAQGAHLAAQEDAGRHPPQFLSESEETSAADALRGKVCDELERRKDDFAPFIDVDEAGSYEAYVSRMRWPGTWGGEPELAVAARLLGRPIAVHMQRGFGGDLEQVSQYSHVEDGSDSSEKSNGKEPTHVPLLFHGAGHYDLLIKPPPKSRL